jgi:hypothetical protein
MEANNMPSRRKKQTTKALETALKMMIYPVAIPVALHKLLKKKRRK